MWINQKVEPNDIKIIVNQEKASGNEPIRKSRQARKYATRNTGGERRGGLISHKSIFPQIFNTGSPAEAVFAQAGTGFFQEFLIK